MTPDVSQVEMSPYVVADELGLLHHSATAVWSDAESVTGVVR